MHALITNLKYLRNLKGFTQQEFADALGVPRPTYSGWERGSAEPSIPHLIQMADLFEVTLDGLLKDELENTSFELNQSAQMRVLAISVDSEGEEQIELIDTKAEAGYLESFKDPEFIKDLPKIKLPDLPVGTYRAFEISGDSMLPVTSGSLIIARYVEQIDYIKNGRTYIVATSNNGLVYKRIQNLPQAQSLLAISDNRVYPPFEIRYEQVMEVWEFHAMIEFNDDQKFIVDDLSDNLSDMNAKLDAIHEKVSMSN